MVEKVTSRNFVFQSIVKSFADSYPWRTLDANINGVMQQPSGEPVTISRIVVDNVHGNSVEILIRDLPGTDHASEMAQENPNRAA